MAYYVFEASGKSRSEAEEAALQALNAEASAVDFDAANEKGGILKFLKSEPVVLRVFAKEQLPIESHLRGVLLTVLQRMGLEANILQVGERDENLYVEIESPDSGFIIGKHGRTLDAIQFLVNLIVNSNTRNQRRIMVDVESYRERRERSLKKLAERMAERVGRSGRSVLLNYMNPYERRIVHLALEKDERVYTESDGNGVYKRVRVIPAGKSAPPPSSREGSGRGRNRNRERDGNRGNGRSRRPSRDDGAPRADRDVDLEEPPRREDFIQDED